MRRPRLLPEVALSISDNVTSVAFVACEKEKPSSTGISQNVLSETASTLVSLLKYKLSLIIISYISKKLGRERLLLPVFSSNVPLKVFLQLLKVLIRLRRFQYCVL